MKRTSQETIFEEGCLVGVITFAIDYLIKSGRAGPTTDDERADWQLRAIKEAGIDYPMWKCKALIRAQERMDAITQGLHR
jgi:hypothetical protein